MTGDSVDSTGRDLDLSPREIALPIRMKVPFWTMMKTERTRMVVRER
jgi:hypothetical protein